MGDKVSFDADVAYSTFEDHRQLASEVAKVREGQRDIALQTAQRTEMDFVQNMNDYRRAKWWTLVAFSACILAALAALTFLIHPPMINRWRAITIAVITLVVCLSIVGFRRDARHVKSSWTRLRFPGM